MENTFNEDENENDGQLFNDSYNNSNSNSNSDHNQHVQTLMDVLLDITPEERKNIEKKKNLLSQCQNLTNSILLLLDEGGGGTGVNITVIKSIPIDIPTIIVKIICGDIFLDGKYS